MTLLYNRKHLHVSVGAAALLGMVLGFWLGIKASDAGVFENMFVFIAFLVASHFVFAAVDRKYLPIDLEDDE